MQFSLVEFVLMTKKDKEEKIKKQKHNSHEKVWNALLVFSRMELKTFDQPHEGD